MSETRNSYLDQVVANQERLEHDLRAKKMKEPGPVFLPSQAAAPVRRV